MAAPAQPAQNQAFANAQRALAGQLNQSTINWSTVGRQLRSARDSPAITTEQAVSLAMQAGRVWQGIASSRGQPAVYKRAGATMLASLDYQPAREWLDGNTGMEVDQGIGTRRTAAQRDQ